jgi:NAD(P)-dependent dehydrogenase (short-subunit alcohol dehydrogenase family)
MSEVSNMGNMSKFAVVTGAGRGIGAATSAALVADGWTVALMARDLGALEVVAKELGNGAIAIACDVSDPESVVKAFGQVKKQFGRLDLLFNNAGISSPGTLLEDIASKDFEQVMAVNVGGVFYCTQQAFAIMKDQNPQGGRIINNGSISAQVPRPNSAPYTASKHAVTGLTRSTSLDGRKYNIACGQIDVGNANTNMAADHGTGVLQAHGGMLAEPMLDPEHVAKSVVHMASLPLDANVQFMTVMATKMPYIGRG